MKTKHSLKLALLALAISTLAGCSEPNTQTLLIQLQLIQRIRRIPIWVKLNIKTRP